MMRHDRFLRALRDLRGFVRLALDSAARISNKTMNVTNCFPFQRTQLHNPKWTHPATTDWLWFSPAAM